MSATALVLWVSLIAVVVVLALAVTQLLRGLRELKRLASRLEELSESPVFTAFERLENDLARLERASEQLRALVARAALAAATIRRGPLPPEVVAAYRVVRVEIAAFRRFARR